MAQPISRTNSSVAVLTLSYYHVVYCVRHTVYMNNFCTCNQPSTIVLLTVCNISPFQVVLHRNGNASETKANESFDNGVFFNIEAKRTPSIVSKLFLKRSEHIR